MDSTENDTLQNALLPPKPQYEYNLETLPSGSAHGNDGFDAFGSSDGPPPEPQYYHSNNNVNDGMIRLYLQSKRSFH